MTKNKGFTLIELLAVIVILTIIALVATPLVLGVIDNIKKNSFRVTCNEIYRAYDKYEMIEKMDQKQVGHTIFDFSSKRSETEIIDGIKYEPIQKLSLKGELPKSGTYEISSDKRELIADNGKYTCIVNENKSEIMEGIVSDNIPSSCSYEVGYSWNFDYSGNSEQFIIPCDGTYKLEVYGAQGGNASVSSGSASGGKGGYSAGNVNLTSNSILNIVVGSKGTDSSSSAGIFVGGYNGGGNGYSSSNERIGAGGGGATHIALGNTNRGELKNYKEYNSEILIVAGGGGGAVIRYYTNGALSNACAGGTGGGTTGGSSMETIGGTYATGGTQTSGYGFGLGENGSSDSVCNGGGGGGYYGGKSTHTSSAYQELSGGGGSGYIAGVTDGTTENGVHEGNGYAKITLVSLDK